MVRLGAVVVVLVGVVVAACGAGEGAPGLTVGTPSGAAGASASAGATVEASPSVAATEAGGTPGSEPSVEATSTVGVATATEEPTVVVTAEVTATVEATPSATSTPSPTATLAATPAATPEETATVAPTVVATERPEPTVPEIRATWLRIPSLGIDAEVAPSEEVPVNPTRPPGCPVPPPGQTTLTVPNQGIATPIEPFEGLERKSWIYGHSRWLGEPGLFFSLQSIGLGAELFVDGVDRVTGEAVTNQRFVVDGLYVTDSESGGALVEADTPEEIPSRAQVILQTSVRERGEGKAWILDRETLLAKSQTVVEGSLDDPCKYLLFFVFASAA